MVQVGRKDFYPYFLLYSSRFRWYLVGRGNGYRDLMLLCTFMAKGWRNKGIVTIIFATIFFGGCVTQKACLQKYPVQETHDTLIVYRDTIIEVPVLGTDTVYRWSTLFDTVYASSGTAHSVSYVTHDTLKLIVWQNDTILRVRLDSAIRELQFKDTEIYTIQQKCDKSKVERALAWVFYIIIVVAFIVLIRFFTKLVK